MKGFLTIAFLVTAIGHADVGQAKVEGQKDSGTAAVDETYVDELKTKKSAIEKDQPVEIDKTWNGQGQVYSKEDDQRMEEKKDEPGGEDQEGSIWDHTKGRK